MLVDRNDQSLFRPPTREHTQHEIQPMPTHDHSLCSAPRLDPEPLRDALRKVRVQRCRTRITVHRSARGSETNGARSSASFQE